MQNENFERGHFEGQVAARLDAIDKKLDMIVSSFSTLEGRVRTLENWRWLVMGGASVAGGLAGYLAKIFL